MSNPTHSPLRLSTGAYVTTAEQPRWTDRVPRRIKIVPLTPTIGAEITGVDLSQPLDDAVRQEIQDALLNHLVVFFRGQTLSPEGLKAFGRQFGQLTTHPIQPTRIEGHPEIFIVRTDEKSESATGEEWHSDLSFQAEPAMGSILHLLEVPPNGGGDTMFANMYAAYETLSPSLQRFLEGLTAIHDSSGPFRGRYADVAANQSYPKSEHPVIRTHPVTGGKLLYVNRVFTTHIAQLKRHESDGLLQVLYRHIETPEFHCRFKWQPGSVAFWDNRVTQHHALWDYFPQRRSGHRVTLAGDRPFYRP